MKTTGESRDVTQQIADRVAEGNDLFTSGQFAEAEAAFRKAIALDPKSAEAYNGLARALGLREKHDEAIEAYRKAVQLWEPEISPARASALVGWGDELQQLGDYAGAEAKHREALKIDADNIAAYNDLGLALQMQGRLAEALDAFGVADRRLIGTPARKIVLVNWGDTLLRQSEFGLAEAKYREALAIDGDNATAYNGLGLALQAENRLAEAVDSFSRAAELAIGTPTRKYALLNWGEALWRGGDYAVAEQKYREALIVDASEPSAYNGLGLALAAQERHADAIDAFRKADELWKAHGSTDRKYALLNWGDVLRQQLDYAGAEAKYRDALAIDADNPNAFTSLAFTLAQQNRVEDATAAYRKADELWKAQGSTDRTYALVGWGDMLYAQPDYAGAEAKYREALEVDALHAGAHNGLGLSLEAQERFPEALEAFRQADKLLVGTVNRKFALANWADVLWRQGDYDGAEAKYREALASDLKYAYAYNGLGQALASKERFPDALEAFRKADELLMGTPERKYALVNWADVLSRLGDFLGAEAKYREALTIDADYLYAYYGLGSALKEQERYQDAVEAFRHADQLLTGRRERKLVLAELGDVLRLQGSYTDAEAEYRQALEVDTDYPYAYWGLGLTLEANGSFEDAIEAFRKADELWSAQGSTDRKYALAKWGSLLREREDFDDACERFKTAVSIDPNDASLRFRYAVSLFDSGSYPAGFNELDAAIAIDQSQPNLHHSKAEYLFQAGRFEEGWSEWQVAKRCYRESLAQGSSGSSSIEMRLDFAGALRDVFQERAEAEELYNTVLAQDASSREALLNLVRLYQQWEEAEDFSLARQILLRHAQRRAIAELSKSGGNTDEFGTCMAAADLALATHDWRRATELLEAAAAKCSAGSLKRSQVAARFGIVCFEREKYKKAIDYFREALLIRPDDLMLMSNLAESLSRDKRFELAELEFSRALCVAPGHIEARIGAAQVCIELGDDGDHDQFTVAENHLTTAIKYGRSEKGSKLLQYRDLANAYYLRGWVRAKQYEDAGRLEGLGLLIGAYRDFKACKRGDPENAKAALACESIAKRMRGQVVNSLTEALGSALVVLAGIWLFLIAQFAFFSPPGSGRLFGWVAAGALKDPASYISVTFGALLFIVVGLYLPRVLKLKVPGIELEKDTINQVAAPSTLGITRTGVSVTSLRPAGNLDPVRDSTVREAQRPPTGGSAPPGRSGGQRSDGLE